MVLSKPINFQEKISKFTWAKAAKRHLFDEEIEIHCFEQKKPISVELIEHMLGGPNMEYKIINLDDSFEVFDYSADKLLKICKESQCEICFFEHRNNTTSNIIVAIVKMRRTKEIREHLCLLVAIRMTVMVTPRVAYCRFFNLCGKLVSLI